jgi:hypothetical protein
MPLPALAAIAAKVGAAVKGMTVSQAVGVTAKKGIFTKIGQGISNMFQKGKSNVDEYGNPFGKFGQAVGNLFRRDSSPQKQNTGPTIAPSTLTQILPISIVGIIVYLIFKK